MVTLYIQNSVVGIIIGLLFALNMISFAQSPKELAQPFVFDPSRYVKAENSAIRVISDRFTGQYRFETIEGIAILFANQDAMTSFTNIRFRNRTFTNNLSRSAQTPPFTERMPFGTGYALPDRVVFEARIGAGNANLLVRQEFFPMLEKDYAFVRLRTTLKNESMQPLPAGLQLMYDIFLDDVDHLDVRVDSVFILREQEWKGNAVPSIWTATSTKGPPVIEGRLNSPFLVPPDQFVVGQWQFSGYVGGAAWDYLPSGLLFGDNAVLMQWNERMIDPGDSVMIGTDYGYLTNVDAALRCNAAEVFLNQSETGYRPNPFAVTAIVKNTGLIKLDSLTLKLSLPAKVNLSSGETSIKKSNVPLLPGDSTLFYWFVVADTASQPSLLVFTIDLLEPVLVRTQCSATTLLPGIPHYSAKLVCGDSLILGLTNDGFSYTPDPLPFTAKIINTGTAPLSNALATITLPQIITLASGSLTEPVNPAVIAPGDTGVVTWMMDVELQQQAGSVQFTVAVSEQHLPQLLCAQTVSYPAMKDPPFCVTNDITTKGTDFWTAFLPNNSGTGAQKLFLLFLPAEDTHVRIEKPNDVNYPREFDVPGGRISTTFFGETTDDMSHETVEHNGIHITTNKPVTLFQGNVRERHSDACQVFPVQALGKGYTTVGYNHEDPYEHFIVAATEDGTNVSIAPFSFTTAGTAPGDTLHILMNAFDTYYVQSNILGASGGLTGSRVMADKPVAVLTGAESGWIPENHPLDRYGFLNPHYDQALSDDFIGTEYVATPFVSRLNGDTYKVVATQDSTILLIGSNPPVLLRSANDSYEFLLADATLIRSTKPIVVAQFANSAAWDDPDNEYGDSSMLILSPTDRFAACYDFPGSLFDIAYGSTGTGGRRLAGAMSRLKTPGVDPDTCALFAALPADGPEASFVNITAFKGGEVQVLFDGRLLPDTLFHPVPNSPYLVARFALKPRFHRISTGDARGVGIIVYGFTTHDAFTLNGGFMVRRQTPFTGADEAPVPQSIKLGKPFPNPASAMLQVDFSLPSQLEVDMRLFDILGKQMRAFVQQPYGAGRHTVSIRTADLHEGVYTLVFRAGGTAMQRTLIVLH
jgi:hypothetical protein